jgi:hypothetical protein
MSLVACQLVTPGIVGLAAGNGSAPLRLLAVMGVALPSLIYAILSIIWIITQLQATMHRGSMR